MLTADDLRCQTWKSRDDEPFVSLRDNTRPLRMVERKVGPAGSRSAECMDVLRQKKRHGGSHKNTSESGKILREIKKTLLLTTLICLRYRVYLKISEQFLKQNTHKTLYLKIFVLVLWCSQNFISQHLSPRLAMLFQGNSASAFFWGSSKKTLSKIEKISPKVKFGPLAT